MYDIEEIKRTVNIVEFADYAGYHVTRIGNFYSLKEHDSVRINPYKNSWVRYSTGDKGSVIDFAMHFCNLDLKEAVKYLGEYENLENKPSFNIIVDDKPIKENESKGLQLPEKDNTYKNVFAYLITSRLIDKDIVKEFVDNKMLYQDVRKNCVFVSYEGENPVFANLRSSNTKKRFVSDVKGCNYKHSFFIDNNSNELLITESVIDAMSCMTIMKDTNKDYHKYNYLCLAGTLKYDKALDYHLEKKEYSRIVLALDNDTAGCFATESILMKVHEKYHNIKLDVAVPKVGKDFNDELKARRGFTNEIEIEENDEIE